MPETILVVFGEQLPKKSQKWYKQFDKVLSQNELEGLIDPGSVQEAYELVDKLPYLTLNNGIRLSKLVNYQGYELWWMNYDGIYYKFCLPYTQYHRLLRYLKEFDKVFLYQAPCPHLFRYFLEAQGRQCVIFSKFRLRNLLPISFGVFLQVVLSMAFLPWLKIIRPRLMLWTSDKFDPPYDFDFRHRFIYQELRKKKILFVEFIRGLESWSVTLQHAWQRKRPVFYSTSIINLVYFFAGLFGQKKTLENSFASADPDQRFQFSIATHYLRNITGTIWSIKVMRFILRWIGIKAAIVTVGLGRTFHELLACKLSGIKTVGIQHGAQIRYFCVYDFMSGFDGEKKLSVDKYGLWSEWWKEYYLSYSRAYKSEQLFISGHMRPLKREISSQIIPEQKEGLLRVLFISETIAVPKEVMPYLLALLETKELDFYLKFRPYRDDFEAWLKKYHPDILNRVKIVRGTMQEAVSRADVAVGSNSTAVLEALLQLKPLVLFKTKKWGDFFEIKSLHGQGCFFAENPEELVDCIKKSVNVSREELKRLQKRFFGDPYQNGSQWVVEQAEAFLKLSEQK